MSQLIPSVNMFRHQCIINNENSNASRIGVTLTILFLTVTDLIIFARSRATIHLAGYLSTATTWCFTPNSPFDNLFFLTHAWYKVTNSQRSIFYFDQLYNAVTINELARKKRCPYVGTFILFSPDQNGTSTPSPAIIQLPPADASSAVPHSFISCHITAALVCSDSAY